MVIRALANRGLNRSNPSSPFPLWRRGLTPLTWTQFGNAPSTVDPEQNPSLNPNYPAAAPWRASGSASDLVEAWCGGTLHRPMRRFRLGPGYGHNDGASNAIFALDYFQDDPAWILEIPPTGCIGNTGTLDDGQEQTAVYFDGKWRATHNYQLTQARGNELWLVTPGAMYRAGGGNLPCIFKYDGITVALLAHGTAAPGGSGGNTGYSSWYDEDRDRFYTVAQNAVLLQYWDVQAAIKGATGCTTNLSGQSMCVRVPELDIVAILSSEYAAHIGVFDYERTAGGAVLEPGATGTPPSFGGYTGIVPFKPNGVWVPGYGGGVGAILCWHGGTSFKVLTPPASGNPATTPWAWSTLSAVGSNTVDPGNPNTNGVYGRLAHEPDLGGILLALSFTQAPYFFALG